MKNIIIRNAIRYISKNPWAQRVSIVAIVLLVVYALAQPQLNKRLGWNLPGIPGVSQQNEDRDGGDSRGRDSRGGDSRGGNSERTELPRSGNAERSEQVSDATGRQVTDSSESPSVSQQSKQSGKLPGELTEIRRNVFESTAGLLYVPGSKEGHRTKHVIRHTQDIPNRREPHGVFDADEKQVFAVLDEAYELVKKNSPQVKARNEGARDVYDINMKRRIGFVGGSPGRKQGNPAAKHVRMVLEGPKVITAFPVRKR